MSSKKGQLPELLFVSPIGGGQTKIRHKHTAAEVVEFDAEGRPKLLRLLGDDELVDVRPVKGKSKYFMTLYAQEKSLVPWESAKGQ